MASLIKKSSLNTISVGNNAAMKLIKMNREDEKKTQLENFSNRLSLLANQVLCRRMDYADAHELLVSEAERFETIAAELNHV